MGGGRREKVGRWEGGTDVLFPKDELLIQYACLLLLDLFSVLSIE